MKKFLSLLVFNLILFFSASCDPGLVNNYIVVNNSDTNLTIISKINKDKRSITEQDSITKVIVKKNQRANIFHYGEIGSVHDKKDEFLKVIDTFVIMAENRKINKDYLERKYWKYSVTNYGYFDIGEVEYELIIENKDFK